MANSPFPTGATSMMSFARVSFIESASISHSTDSELHFHPARSGGGGERSAGLPVQTLLTHMRLRQSLPNRQGSPLAQFGEQLAKSTGDERSGGCVHTLLMQSMLVQSVPCRQN